MRTGAFSVGQNLLFKAVEKELKINSTNDKNLQISTVWRAIIQFFQCRKNSFYLKNPKWKESL